MKHTELPWVLDGIQIHKVEAGGKFADGQKVIAVIGQRLPKKEAKANAEFIVRACNSYEELVHACKVAVRIMEDGDNDIDPETGNEYIDYTFLREALAKATK